MVPLTKKIMDNGTITIPLELRKMLGLELGDNITVMVPLKQEGKRGA